MALPNTGPLTMTQIASEFPDTAPYSLSEFYRGGGKVPNTPGNTAVPTSGQIAIGNFYGTQNRSAITLTISGNTLNYNLYNSATANPGYVAGSTDVTLNINGGVNVGSNSTGSYAMAVPSQFNPADVIVINNQGTIIGRGGDGGLGGGVNSGSTGGGGAGGAIQVSRPVTINNVGTLAGGGGGGGGGAFRLFSVNPKTTFQFPGGGGGGGAGYNAGSGGSSKDGLPNSANPGQSGSINGGGAGGNAYYYSNPNTGGGPGGPGGGRGAGGSAGTPGNSPGSPGGSAGQYLNGSPYVTWQSTGTRQGGVS